MPSTLLNNILEKVKGWNKTSPLDFEAPVASSVSVVIPRGACASLNSSKELILGVGTTNVMPLFVTSSSDDADIANDGGDPATEANAYAAVTPSGNLGCLVGSGGYELSTTNFVAGDYSPNDPLTSPLAGDDAGKLEVGTRYTDMIVGIVSRGVVANSYGKNALFFWTFPIFPS